ncbi:MAG: 50S ribosomal protein L11 methyltransferase [Promethearchaeota archaeon]|nr:MAG: 50S ribosomal protein L11 methyltransferase [Candidatus Lokiarchaeota archaeon]
MKISKKELISIIQKTETFTNPKIELEQYCIDANCAVDIIYYAGFEFKDINKAFIIDLGAGTGRLSIASALFNANYVLSVDIDMNALNILRKNILTLELEQIIFPICADIEYFQISKRLIHKNMKVTTIMNPPFGVQTRFADRAFLKKAISFSDIIYSIHLANKKIYKFISNYVKKLKWKIDNVLPFTMILERAFPFHTQNTKKIDVHVYRFIKE